MTTTSLLEVSLLLDECAASLRRKGQSPSRSLADACASRSRLPLLGAIEAITVQAILPDIAPAMTNENIRISLLELSALGFYS